MLDLRLLYSRLEAFYAGKATILRVSYATDSVGYAWPLYQPIEELTNLICTVGVVRKTVVNLPDGTQVEASRAVALAGYYPDIKTDMYVGIAGISDPYRIVGITSDQNGATTLYIEEQVKR